jgi:hypothetical protein
VIEGIGPKNAAGIAETLTAGEDSGVVFVAGCSLCDRMSEESTAGAASGVTDLDRSDHGGGSHETVGRTVSTLTTSCSAS